MFAASKTSAPVNGVTSDPQFNYVTMLLHGDGTNGAQNNTFLDSSTNNYSITRTGNATQGSYSPYGANWSNYFDGTDDTLNLPASAALLGSGSYTVEFWVNLPVAPSGGAYFTCFAYGSSGAVLRCFLLNDTVTKLGIWIGASNIVYVNTSAMIGSWAHIALVRSGTTFTAYVNGVSVATTTDSTNFNTGQLYIGSQASTNFLTGYISNFRVVVGTAVYLSNFTPSIIPLTPIAGTSLFTCQSQSFIDNSINAYTITSTGNTSVQRFSPFSPVIQTPVSYSTYFDGNGDNLSINSSTAFGFGTGDFTIEFWAYSTSTARQDWVDISDGTNRVLFYYSGSAVTFYGNGVTAITGSALTTNAWVHYALVKSSGSTKLYVNGTQAGSTYATNQNYGTTAAVSIGKDMFGSTYITGYLSNFRVVKGTAVYTAAFTPPTSPLAAVSGTSLLTCQSPTIVDNSTNAFPITVNGNAIARSQNPFGVTSYSQYFDGSGDYLTAPSNAAFAFGTGDFTVEGWLYLTGNQNFGAMFISSTTGTGNSLHIQISSANKVRLTNETTELLLATNAIPTNTWAYIAVVRSGTTLSIYQNGVLNGSTTNSTNFIQNGATIGYEMIGGSFYYAGYISNLRVVKGTAVYTAAFSPPTAPLTAVSGTSLLTCQNLDAIDNSPNAFTITKNGNVTGSMSNPFPVNPYITTGTDLTTGLPYTTATFGGSGYLRGGVDWITSATTVSATADFTLECWFNLTLPQQNYRMISGSTIDGLARYLAINSTGIEMQFGTASSTIMTFNYTFKVGVWYHIAITRVGSTIRAFINGVSQSLYQGTQTNTFSVKYVGVAYLETYAFPGYISDFRFVVGTALYTGGFVPPAAPLTAVTNTALLCNMTNAGIYDNAMMNDLQTIGNAQVSTSVVKYGTGSIALDGNGDYVVEPTNLNFGYGTSDFTIEFWLYLNTASADQTLVSNLSNAASTNPHLYYLNNTGIRYYTNSADRIIGASLAPNTWYHIALCKSSGSTKLFINGTQTGSTYTDTNNYGSSAPLGIGTYWSSNSPVVSSTLNGYVDDLRITKGYARYTANFTPPTAAFPNTGPI